MTKEFLRSPFMFLCYFSTLIFAYPVLFFQKGSLELLINEHHLPFLDLFFKYVTFFGDGLLMGLLLLGLLFYNYLSAVIAAISIVFQSLIVSIFKRWLYKGLERPLSFFGDTLDLNFVDGVEVHSSNTFPSGHTTTGFAIFAILFIVFQHRSLIVTLSVFLMAFLVGFSRIYLLQHFVVDVYFGAIFGTMSVIGALYAAEVLMSARKLNLLQNTSLRNLFIKK